MKSHGYVTEVRESLNPGLQNAPKPPAPRWGFFMPETHQRPRQGEDLHMGLSTTGGRAATTRAHSLRLALYLWPQRLVLQEGGGHCLGGEIPKTVAAGLPTSQTWTNAGRLILAMGYARSFTALHDGNLWGYRRKAKKFNREPLRRF